MGQDGGATRGLPGEGGRAGERTVHATTVLPTVGRLPGMATHALGSVGCPREPWCVHPPRGAEVTELHGVRLSISLPPSLAACSSILAGPLSSGSQSVPKGGREIEMGGTGMGVPG